MTQRFMAISIHLHERDAAIKWLVGCEQATPEALGYAIGLMHLLTNHVHTGYCAALPTPNDVVRFGRACSEATYAHPTLNGRLCIRSHDDGTFDVDMNCDAGPTPPTHADLSGLDVSDGGEVTSAEEVALHEFEDCTAYDEAVDAEAEALHDDDAPDFMAGIKKFKLDPLPTIDEPCLYCGRSSLYFHEQPIPNLDGHRITLLCTNCKAQGPTCATKVFALAWHRKLLERQGGGGT